MLDFNVYKKPKRAFDTTRQNNALATYRKIFTSLLFAKFQSLAYMLYYWFLDKFGTG